MRKDKRFRANYEPHRHPGVVFIEPSLTKQSFKDECDVNRILRRFETTGELPVMRSKPLYGDFSSIPDYQTALDQIRAADYAFSQLSAKVRERFSNDPARFIQFMSDPRNASEMIQLGLASQPRKIDQGASPSPATGKGTPGGSQLNTGATNPVTAQS